MYNYGDYYQQRWLEDHLLSKNVSTRHTNKSRLEKLLKELNEVETSDKDFIGQDE